ncbi:kinase-like protein [Amniculicola lignicola CBS 123094]|uniref:Kinase-like protein n=1 Tax=Amniculicola lignicola CBS 123094 TaxID=1392246 RepID=A0A6A5WEN4_9PLEO|nr:kinase-like protein [Amniculicola lignicola CBS 123094]
MGMTEDNNQLEMILNYTKNVPGFAETFLLPEKQNPDKTVRQLPPGDGYELDSASQLVDLFGFYDPFPGLQESYQATESGEDDDGHLWSSILGTNLGPVSHGRRLETMSIFYHSSRSYPLGPPPQVKKSRNLILTISKDAHLDIQEGQDLPYRLIKNLGHGATASVELVQDVNTGLTYARKSFKNVYSRNLEEVKQTFHNEVRVMRRLASHHHIVRVFASYVRGRELSLILDPVADGGDLAAFLQAFKDLGEQDPRREEQKSIIRRAFGCLMVGLEFMHRQTVRHKDIKPQNILIHQGMVLYTDFGIALDHSQQGHSTTTGNPQSFTRRYCAPEVADWGSRNSKSDIFSLGCVYLEMMNALDKQLVPESLLGGPFHLNLDLIYSYYTRVNITFNPTFENASKTMMINILEMISATPSQRPIAGLLLSRFSSNLHFSQPQSQCWFCTSCSSPWPPHDFPTH